MRTRRAREPLIEQVAVHPADALGDPAERIEMIEDGAEVLPRQAALESFKEVLRPDALKQVGQRQATSTNDPGRRNHAELAGESQERTHIGRPRDADPDGDIDPFVAQSRYPSNNCVSVKSELGCDLDCAAGVLEEGELPLEGAPQRIGIDLRMPFRIGDDADMANGMVLQDPAFQESEGVAIGASRRRGITADKNEAPWPRFADQG